MNNYEVYKKSFLARLKGYVTIAALVFALVAIIFIPQHLASGTYEPMDAIMIPLIFAAMLVVIYFYLLGMGMLGFKSQTMLYIAILCTLPLGIYFYTPIFRYHNGGDSIMDRLAGDKMLRDTIKAYQKAWKRQNFKNRVIKPLLAIVLVAVAVYGFIFLSESMPDVFPWVALGILALAYFCVLTMLGGVQDVTITTTTYDVSIGKDWWDYGEVHAYETGSKTKDGTRLDPIAAVLAIPLTGVALVVAVVGLFVWITISLLGLILPLNGKHTIYLHKKTGMNPRYIPLGQYKYTKKIMLLINRLLGFLFSINLVNEDFWFEGVGTKYIRTYLSPRNTRYLEKQLAKVERKHGGYYTF